MNKERLVFEIADGVMTLEEITPWEGGAHDSGDEVFSFIQFLKHSVSLYWNLTRVDPSFIGCKTEDRLEYLSSTNMISELSQSSGEPILAFIGCQTGGKPNR